jgi:hypothetical protein
MSLPEILVSTKALSGDSALLLLDLETGSYKNVLHHAVNFASLQSTRDHVYLLRSEIADTAVLQVYDRTGLVGLRRVEDCCDAHGMALIGSEIAVCSTGTNQIIFLDQNGTEKRRWSPDDSAEGDSWHLNSLAVHENHLWATCFGRFPLFRGWNGHTHDAGMLIDVPSGRTVIDNLTAPHDPRGLNGGWLINEAGAARTMFFPTHGKPQLIAQFNDFTRGLLVFPQFFVIATSGHRHQAGGGGATVHIVDRETQILLKSLELPYREIAHLFMSPGPELVAALQLDPHGLRQRFSPPCSFTIIQPNDRCGSISALTPITAAADGGFEVLICVSNNSRITWASNPKFYFFVSYEIVNAKGDVLLTGALTGLPIPLLAGKSQTFPIRIDPSVSQLVRGPCKLRISMVQQCIDWWHETATWKPAVLDLPASSCPDVGTGKVLVTGLPSAA